MRRLGLSFIAALLCVVATGGTASAAPAPTTKALYQLTATTADGRVAYDSGQVPAGSKALSARMTPGTIAANPGVPHLNIATPSDHGCYGSIHFQLTKWDATWPVHVRDWNFDSWVGYYCWSQPGGQVWNPNNPYGPIDNWQGFSNIATCCWTWGGIISHSADFYGPWWHAGFYSDAQAVFHNCIAKYGCIGDRYPWIHAQLWDDGEYFFQAGGS